MNLFLLQSSILSLALSAYDRVMVLRKDENYGPRKSRFKNTLLFSVLLPLSYAVCKSVKIACFNSWYHHKINRISFRMLNDSFDTSSTNIPS